MIVESVGDFVAHYGPYGPVVDSSENRNFEIRDEHYSTTHCHLLLFLLFKITLSNYLSQFINFHEILIEFNSNQ